MTRLLSDSNKGLDIPKLVDTLPVKRVTTRLDADDYRETGLYIADMWTGVTRDGLNVPTKNPLALLVINFDTVHTVQICIPRDVQTTNIVCRHVYNNPAFNTDWKKIGG
ncbi:MAG: pyocin knob domain-containing protein [Aerococcus sanguinicola]